MLAADAPDRSKRARRRRRQKLPQIEAALIPHVRLIRSFGRNPAHWRLTAPDGWVVDFWPTTESWREPHKANARAGAGLGLLIAALSEHQLRAA